MTERIEKDFLGEVQVSQSALYGVQTLRAVQNFPISGLRTHPALIRAIGWIKQAAAQAHLAAGEMPKDLAEVIIAAAGEVAAGKHNEHFVVDVYQAGAGTSFNMNANEVIANRANELLGQPRGAYQPVHPNDQVNMAQSTNDVFPTTMRLAALSLALDLEASLLALEKALPGQYYTSFYRGLMLHALEDREKALKEFETALERQPVRLNLPDIYSHMGACQKDLQQYEQAVETCRLGLDIDPQRPDMFNTMGFCRFMQKDHRAALACFEKALEIDPSMALNYANIGSCYRELGEIKLAVQYYEMALEIDPSIEFARTNIEKLKAG